MVWCQKCQKAAHFKDLSLCKTCDLLASLVVLWWWWWWWCNYFSVRSKADKQPA